MAAGRKCSRAASATRSASTGTQLRRSSTLPTTAATGSREDLPEDELNRVTKVGQHFGFPYCHQGNFTDREVGWGRHVTSSVKPIALLGPHVAALGMRFYRAACSLPNTTMSIFIARARLLEQDEKDRRRCGSIAKLNKDGTVKSIEPFLTGFIQNNEYIGRPVDVQVMKDGSLLVSDDHAGAVYRVSYGTERVAGR